MSERAFNLIEDRSFDPQLEHELYRTPLILLSEAGLVGDFARGVGRLGAEALRGTGGLAGSALRGIGKAGTATLGHLGRSALSTGANVARGIAGTEDPEAKKTAAYAAGRAAATKPLSPATSGAIGGAALGTALAGPAGGVVGGLAGGALGKLNQWRQQRQAAQNQPTATPPAGQQTPPQTGTGQGQPAATPPAATPPQPQTTQAPQTLGQRIRGMFTRRAPTPETPAAAAERAARQGALSTGQAPSAAAQQATQELARRHQAAAAAGWDIQHPGGRREIYQPETPQVGDIPGVAGPSAAAQRAVQMRTQATGQDREAAALANLQLQRMRGTARAGRTQAQGERKKEITPERIDRARSGLERDAAQAERQQAASSRSDWKARKKELKKMAGGSAGVDPLQAGPEGQSQAQQSREAKLAERKKLKLLKGAAEKVKTAPKVGPKKVAAPGDVAAEFAANEPEVKAGLEKEAAAKEAATQQAHAARREASAASPRGRKKAERAAAIKSEKTKRSFKTAGGEIPGEATPPAEPKPIVTPGGAKASGQRPKVEVPKQEKPAPKKLILPGEEKKPAGQPKELVVPGGKKMKLKASSPAAQPPAPAPAEAPAAAAPDIKGPPTGPAPAAPTAGGDAGGGSRGPAPGGQEGPGGIQQGRGVAQERTAEGKCPPGTRAGANKGACYPDSKKESLERGGLRLLGERAHLRLLSV
ncbi:MAG: hypothetical protein AB7L09_00265 [Nitrospira sp.]